MICMKSQNSPRIEHTVQEFVDPMLDTRINHCLQQRGSMWKQRCIFFIPVNMAPTERKALNQICNDNGYINIETVREEELIVVLLQPFSHIHIFSYTMVHDTSCKVLTPVKEQGMHGMILKWISDDCESLTLASNITLHTCEIQPLLNDEKDYIPLYGLNGFTCKSGTCLAFTIRSDDHVDCISGEDEIYCLDIVKAGSYKCKDGKIITAKKRCNFITDCANGDDENNCFHVITSCAHRFRCGNGQCVNLEYICDGLVHCVDHSDERTCLVSFNFGYLCADSSCVLRYLKDDLIPDCTDGSDEPMYQLLLNKEINNRYKCPEIGMIPCEKGHNRCFPITQFCILEYNINYEITPCRSGAHLKHCKHFPCTGSFKCPNSYCVPVRYICNG